MRGPITRLSEAQQGLSAGGRVTLPAQTTRVGVMKATRLLAISAALILAAGCANEKHTATATSPTSSTAPAASQQAAPAPGAPLAQLISWIKAGTPADGPKYHHTTGGNDSSNGDLKTDIAFTSPSGKISCITQGKYMDGLTCMVKLTNPPTQPRGEDECEWIGGWIEYNGNTAGVGSCHGDPGPFIAGQGAALPYGSRLTYHDYTCRMDQAGLYCASPAAKSGMQINAGGIVPFGCLRKATTGYSALNYAC